MEARDKLADFIGAGLLILVGTGFAVGSLQYGLSDEEGIIGPGFFPLVAGALLAFFGILIGLVAALGKRETSIAEPPREPDEELGQAAEQSPEEERAARRVVGIIFGLTLVAILLAPALGFLPSFGLLIFALVTFVEKKRPLYGVVIGAGGVAVIWLVFTVFLQIPLPEGILGLVSG